MKERPILFSAPMVRAILEGRKTVTRRVVKPFVPRIGAGAMPSDVVVERDGFAHRRCPYGQPGDRLWVRETWGVGSRPDQWGGYDGIEYRADEDLLDEGDDLPCHKVMPPDGIFLCDYRAGWHPSIHMPRWASRITLEVTGVRVERLNEISAESAVAEGLRTFPHKGDFAYAWQDDDHHGHGSATGAFRNLWESINGDGSWAANPWVWVVEFRRIEQEAMAA